MIGARGKEQFLGNHALNIADKFGVAFPLTRYSRR
jgi:hypothetical protein